MNNLHDVLRLMNTEKSVDLKSLMQMVSNMNLHVGEYKLSARETDMGGWLICDGRSLSRAKYTALFGVIGTKFGSDNADTFKLPDYRGRVIGQPGLGAGLSTRAMGDAVGTETHTLTEEEMPAHTHSGSTGASGAHTHTVNDPGHTHTQTTTNDDFNNSGENPPGFTADSAGTMTWNNINSSTTGITLQSAGSHTHSFTTHSCGASEAHNNMQPTLFGANVFIFAGN